MPEEPLINRLGILVGGGPAPGLNGVIAAATIEGINQGYEVIGFRDGFKHIAAGDTTQIKPLAIRDVKDIHLKGGSILGSLVPKVRMDPKGHCGFAYARSRLATDIPSAPPNASLRR